MSPNIVVVGAGIVGASIAYHLSRRGAAVTLIDKDRPASGATAASWAWLNASRGNPRPYFELRYRSMLEWRRLSDEIGRKLQVDWCGSLLWELSEAELEAYVAEHSSWGYDIRLVDQAQIKKLDPFIRHRPKLAALAPCEGALDPIDATDAMIWSAKRYLGLKTMVETEVLGIETKGGRATGVRTANGAIDADIVILAAGVATTELAGNVDVKLPQAPKPGIMAWFMTQKRLISHLVVSDKLMIKQLNDQVIVAEEIHSQEPDTADPKAAGERIRATIAEEFKHGDKVALIRAEVGVRPIPADRFPAQGFAPALDGLYLSVTHSGVTLAPILGRYAAAEILDDQEMEHLAPYRPERFA